MSIPDFVIQTGFGVWGDFNWPSLSLCPAYAEHNYFIEWFPKAKILRENRFHYINQNIWFKSWF